jgi:hypothetical protein
MEREPNTLRHFALPRCGLGALSCKEQQELNSREERLLYENLWSRQPDTEVVNVSSRSKDEKSICALTAETGLDC